MIGLLLLLGYLAGVAGATYAFVRWRPLGTSKSEAQVAALLWPLVACLSPVVLAVEALDFLADRANRDRRGEP